MIDAPMLMLVGTVIQMVMPARAIVTRLRWRRATIEAIRSLPYTPLPRRQPDLDALVGLADEALARRT